MAEIHIERKKRSPLVWILLLLALAAIGYALYTMYGPGVTDTTPVEPTTTTVASSEFISGEPLPQEKG